MPSKEQVRQEQLSCGASQGGTNLEYGPDGYASAPELNAQEAGHQSAPAPGVAGTDYPGSSGHGGPMPGTY